jgi:thioredoxin 1
VRGMSRLRVGAAVLGLAVSGLVGAVGWAQGPRRIYSDTANAKAEVEQALAKARQEHKRVILDFGGNWCGDCQVLDIYFHDPSNVHLLNQYYELVDIDIGEYNRNLDMAQKYGIPLQKGVPALVVLSPAGRVVYAQTHGEFEKMSGLDSRDVTEFLMKWRPGAAAKAPARGE